MARFAFAIAVTADSPIVVRKLHTTPIETLSEQYLYFGTYVCQFVYTDRGRHGGFDNPTSRETIL
ncbi:hypothetical protein [Providencia rettgeri]|uniref:hypothetical protein n=1 Tax=Providencia rettgeri TaxID=587 RepID=UPI0013A58C8D